MPYNKNYTLRLREKQNYTSPNKQLNQTQQDQEQWFLYLLE